MTAQPRRHAASATRRRTPRPPLSREEIVRTAMRLVDDQGVEALSMRGLGAALGVDSMAIYYYIPGKAALFDAIVETIYGEVEAPELDSSKAWPQLAAGSMRALRQALRRHPNALPILATRPPAHGTTYGLVERALELLVKAGFTASRALDTITCLSVYTIGHVLAEVGRPVGGETTATSLGEGESDTAFPLLAAAFNAGYRPDEQYELGLKAMLAGLSAGDPR